MRKKEFSPNYFREAVRWGGFLFSVYSVPMIKCSPRRLRFLFLPCFSACTSSTYASVSCRGRLFVVSGKGSSGLSRTKKGRFGKPLEQQSPRFHFITGSILALNLVDLASYLFIASSWRLKVVDFATRSQKLWKSTRCLPVGWATCYLRIDIHLRSIRTNYSGLFAITQ